MSRDSKIFRMVLFIGAVSTLTASATEVQSTSFTAWMNTVDGTVGAWDHALPPGAGALDNAAGYNMNVGSFGLVNITGPDGSGYLLNGNADPVTFSGAADGVGSLVLTTEPTTGLTAFFLELKIAGAAAPVSLVLSNGEQFALYPTPAPDGSAFLGLSSYQPITSMVLSTTSGSGVVLADLYAGQSNEPTPELATTFMACGGLMLLSLRLRFTRDRPR